MANKKKQKNAAAEEKNEQAETLAQDALGENDEISALKAEVAELTAQKDAAIAGMQRAQADFINFKRRNASVAADSFLDGEIEVVNALLPVLDDFERMLACETTDAAYAEGAKMVYRRLTDELKKLGVTEISCDGAFDPRLHNAVMMEKVEGKESGAIVEVLRKGYIMNNRIIRHSMVKIAE